MEARPHLALWVRLRAAHLIACSAALKRWNGGHHTHDVRVAASLLHPLLKDGFITAADVRRRVRTVVQHNGTALVDGVMRPTWCMGMESMPTVAAPPAPSFPCAACGQKVFTRKDALFHCRTRGETPRETRGRMKHV